MLCKTAVCQWGLQVHAGLTGMYWNEMGGSKQTKYPTYRSHSG